jgi:hypothetical protein
LNKKIKYYKLLNIINLILGLTKSDGIYPDFEQGCSVFFHCLNKEKIREAKCPDSLKFNQISSRCDNPKDIMPPCGINSQSSSASSFYSIINYLIIKAL